MRPIASKRCPPCCDDAARHTLGDECPWVHDMLAIFGTVLANRVPPDRLESLAPCRRAPPLEPSPVSRAGKRPGRLRLLD